jgi:D-alanine-D-alanine ligase
MNLNKAVLVLHNRPDNNFNQVGCSGSDTGRVDIRLDAGGNPSFIEINPLPGLHPHHSDLPMIATQEGMSYKELLASIIDSALEKGDS